MPSTEIATSTAASEDKNLLTQLKTDKASGGNIFNLWSLKKILSSELQSWQPLLSMKKTACDGYYYPDFYKPIDHFSIIAVFENKQALASENQAASWDWQTWGPLGGNHLSHPPNLPITSVSATACHFARKPSYIYLNISACIKHLG